MDSPDPSRGAASRALDALRRCTRTVQLLPFAYLVLYGSYLLLSCFIPEELLALGDSMMTVSPAFTAFLLFLSRLLKLCRWHRAACLLPTSSQVETFVDSYLVTFTQNEIALLNIALGTAALGYAAITFRHFFVSR